MGYVIKCGYSNRISEWKKSVFCCLFMYNNCLHAAWLRQRFIVAFVFLFFFCIYKYFTCVHVRFLTRP